MNTPVFVTLSERTSEIYSINIDHITAVVGRVGKINGDVGYWTDIYVVSGHKFTFNKPVAEVLGEIAQVRATRT